MTIATNEVSEARPTMAIASTAGQDRASGSRLGLWTLLVAVVVLWFAFAMEIRAIVHRLDGKFIYCLDDAYIHMAIAKHAALNGTWGLTPYEFSSSSSSLLWTILLTLVYAVAGPQDLAPLVLNVIFSTLLVVVLWGLLRSFRLGTLASLSTLLLVILVMPLVPVALTGLEHVLQALVVVAFVAAAAQSLDGNHCASGKDPSGCSRAATVAACLSPVVTLVRYEGLFLVFMVGLVFMLRGQKGRALLIVVLGCLPVVVAGAIFLSKGWLFLPASVAIKGNLPLGSPLAVLKSFFYRGYELGNAPHLAVLMGLATLAVARYGTRVLREPVGIMCVVFAGASIFQVLFASLGWFYRYESYLMCLGTVVVVLLVNDTCREWSKTWRGATFLNWSGLAIALLMLAVPIVINGVRAYVRTPRVAANIHDREFQVGRFLQKYYQGEAIAACDLGALNYLADLHCVDMWGLGNIRVARAKLANKYDTAAMREITHDAGVKMAVVPMNVFEFYGGVPSEWIKVGRWTISDNVICNSDTITFYAVDPAELPALRRHLEDFRAELPKGVTVSMLPPPPDVAQH